MTGQERAQKTVDEIKRVAGDNERIIRRQKIIGYTAFAAAILGLAGNWLVARNWFGLFPDLDPSLQLLILEVSQLLTGAGIGVMVTLGLAWKDANKLIGNVANGANKTIEALNIEMTTLRLAYGSIEKAMQEAMRAEPDLDESGRLSITPRWIELCHTLDAAAARTEIRFADGGQFVDEQHALVLMHSFRISYPEYSLEEKAASRDWLKARNLDAEMQYGVNVTPPKGKMN